MALFKQTNMNIELKKQIVLWIFDNVKYFQLTNLCVEQFRPYIYDASGSFLIGGVDVYKFICDQVELISR